jgi:type I restriction enzyme, S subunit
MSSKAGRRLVPEFRFPDFKKLPAWVEQTLLYLCESPLSNGVFNDPGKTGSGYKLINVADMYTEGCIQENSLSLIAISTTEFERNKVEFGDIFFTRSSLVKSGIAASNIYLGHSADVTFDGHLIRLRLNKLKYAPIFINYLLKTQSVRRQLVAKGKTATMTTIGQSDVAATRLSVTKLDEQQKIADCLSSLDDVIAAQAQKIEILKAHKKGLMQQLFPAEGETVPRLRFPEFRDIEEWEIYALGKIGKNLDSQRIPITENSRTKGTVPYYGASGIIDYVEEFIFDDELLCISEDGANLVARSLPIAFSISGKSWVNNHAHVIKFPEQSTQYLVETYLNEIRLEDFLTGAAQPKLNKAMLDSIPIPLPSLPEQHRVAECLRGVGNVIACSRQTYEGLLALKRSLMQGLFPTVDTLAA